jgi:hypothetical protein
LIEESGQIAIAARKLGLELEAMRSAPNADHSILRIIHKTAYQRYVAELEGQLRAGKLREQEIVALLVPLTRGAAAPSFLDARDKRLAGLRNLRNAIREELAALESKPRLDQTQAGRLEHLAHEESSRTETLAQYEARALEAFIKDVLAAPPEVVERAR